MEIIPSIVRSEIRGLLAFHVHSRLVPYRQKGRSRCWLQYEWDQAETCLKPAFQCPELWAHCLRYMPTAEFGLVAYGEVGIKLHRDAPEFDPLATIINLGPCTWLKGDERLALHGGEVFTFNSQELHGVTNCHPKRWVIALWRMGEVWRSKQPA